MGGLGTRAQAHLSLFAPFPRLPLWYRGVLQWYTRFGMFAAADAINAGFVTPSEAADLVALNFNDSVNVCGE